MTWMGLVDSDNIREKIQGLYDNIKVIGKYFMFDSIPDMFQIVVQSTSVNCLCYTHRFFYDDATLFLFWFVTSIKYNTVINRV